MVPLFGRAHEMASGFETRLTGQRPTMFCGTIFLFPGRTEYIELQGRLARDLVARGFSVLTIDWRGHGLSQRLLDNPATLHVEAYSDYQNDVDAFLQIASTLRRAQALVFVGQLHGRQHRFTSDPARLPCCSMLIHRTNVGH